MATGGEDGGGGLHNLPARRSSLHGRAAEVTAVAEGLADSRLVTVTGPGGVGKTRLAVEVAARLTGAYPDGVWLVDVAGVHDAGGLAATVAAGLSLGEYGGRPSPDTLAAALRERRPLLLLDNCEHVLQACAALVERLLETCPRVSVLATSQAALDLAGERVHALDPLASPPADMAAGDPTELAGYPAVSLFVERARAQRADFTLTVRDAPAVAEICRRLDGMPLAIELAASYVAVLSPAEIAQRLDDRFGLLTRGTRTAVARHQTLRATLDWSYDLLGDRERQCFRRLAVFAGGFTPQAAAEVCPGGDLDADQVPGLLAALVARSLVVADADAAGRHRLLDTTRSYARAHLDEAGETAAAQSRHARHYLGLAERAAVELAEGDQRTWLARLDAERDNLHTALSSAVGRGDTELLARMAGALVLFWSMRGRFQEGLAWLESAAAAATQPRLRATALWGAGLLARQAGDYPVAVARASESLALADQEGDVRLRARALGVLGATGVSARDETTPAAVGQLEESVALARDAGDAWCEIGALVPLGLSHLLGGQPAAARRRFEQALALAERVGGQAGEGHRLQALLGLGRATLAEGDHQTAEAQLTEALQRSRALRVPAATVTALRFLGEAARVRGDHDAAERSLAEAVAIAEPLGPAASVTALLSLGKVALDRGDAATAGRILSRARTLVGSQGREVDNPGVLVGLGAAQRLEGDLDGARTQLEEALAAAHRADDHGAAADALHELGDAARGHGDHERAESLHRDALARYTDHGDRPGTAACLEALAGLAAADERGEDAALLLGAAQAVRDAGGYARAPADQPRYEADLARVREALPVGQFEAAWQEGSRMSAQEAAAASAPGGQRPRVATGWDSLTDREREVVLLAAENLTNPEIGERLTLSTRTVKRHLEKAYPKLGVASRYDLAEVVRLHAPDG